MQNRINRCLGFFDLCQSGEVISVARPQGKSDVSNIPLSGLRWVTLIAARGMVRGDRNEIQSKSAARSQSAINCGGLHYGRDTWGFGGSCPAVCIPGCVETATTVDEDFSGPTGFFSCTHCALS